MRCGRGRDGDGRGGECRGEVGEDWVVGLRGAEIREGLGHAVADDLDAGDGGGFFGELSFGSLASSMSSTVSAVVDVECDGLGGRRGSGAVSG